MYCVCSLGVYPRLRQLCMTLPNIVLLHTATAWHAWFATAHSKSKGERPNGQCISLISTPAYL
jgi:hypothetical protein